MTRAGRAVEPKSRDAGDAFRLVGFYPSVDGGEAQLEVNLDAGGPGTKSGTLWARDFTVLGDSGGERRARRSRPTLKAVLVARVRNQILHIRIDFQQNSR